MIPMCLQMGCGRSKPHLHHESSDDSDLDKKSKHKKSLGKSDKCVCNSGNKVGDTKENNDLSKSASNKRKDSGMFKLPQKNSGAVSSNGVQKVTQGLDVKKSKLDNGVPNTTQPKVRVTNSQLDFFKMLDEKIEQGRDYETDEESERTIENDRVSSEQ
ncbi:uncharacterized protein LOC125678856 [Ostrea edulis]|uniref:uncharacterized protein LOC125678856 n=1 Tax=Ostrea edulis TaxID=37623 RepID=UPI00209539F5|nr:uncharacterized protein LOC125678856 [Ostrea edulis]XP_048773541.1 uncharacterized protein LOC125678856 [Ostrea edulis]XP_048773542.1 uncharacterized protein LOC125678856 [Ostrea edulis]XP_048773543.1 uncharacterized protein LOC125678856 [Ostrea edulis]XP_048773544.1 uncharacterized protein LOC125678856 [Ostrea edulis]XP_048773546.1 uncharacterized protein LOC125678856 [Ostrea edulis]XP_048773547.1 uncharacterized protein LOC125678856 [Ostrea edulis]XP_048773548.1 uncharacterized protein 